MKGQGTPSPHGATDVSTLPLHPVPAKGGNPMALAVMLSGDGGWASIDKRIADVLAAHGVAVVGFDSRSYLMKARTPDESSADVGRVMRHYSAQWAVPRVAIVGYSRGADIAPFIVNRLPAPLREQIILVALLGPAERANFQFHWADLLSDTSRPSDIPILPELERLRGTPVLCVYGKDEKETLCRLADTAAVKVDQRSGHHHFDGDYDAIATEILRLLAPLDANGR
jgi:type IV secretory pathway VirJ component